MGGIVSNIKAHCLEKTSAPSRGAVIVCDNVLSMAQTGKLELSCDHFEQNIETQSFITATSSVVTHTYRKAHPRTGSLGWGLFRV